MKILIVGGGMGGTILANNLARRLSSELRSGKVKMTMLSASDKHMYQPGLLYLAIGRTTPDELYKDQASLLEPGISFFVDPVEEFMLDNNRVKTKSGKTFDYDVIAIATGSRPAPELTPGLAENAHIPMKRVGIPDVFGESGESDELMEKYGLTVENIVDAAHDVIHRKKR